MDNCKTAILVVDMLNDFVTGALKCERGAAIVPKTVELLSAARKNGVKVIFCNDAHIKGVDNELKLWGDHAIAGTIGAQVIPELNVSDNDYIIAKRRYSGFFRTDLDLLLNELGIDTVVLVGLQTHLCVLHTAADAYFLGYNVIIASDATDAFTKECYDGGINYIRQFYGATVSTVKEIIERITAKH